MNISTRKKILWCFKSFIIIITGVSVYQFALHLKNYSNFKVDIIAMKNYDLYLLLARDELFNVYFYIILSINSLAALIGLLSYKKWGRISTIIVFSLIIVHFIRSGVIQFQEWFRSSHWDIMIDPQPGFPFIHTVIIFVFVCFIVFFLNKDTKSLLSSNSGDTI